MIWTIITAHTLRCKMSPQIPNQMPFIKSTAGASLAVQWGGPCPATAGAGFYPRQGATAPDAARSVPPPPAKFYFVKKYQRSVQLAKIREETKLSGIKVKLHVEARAKHAIANVMERQETSRQDRGLRGLSHEDPGRYSCQSLRLQRGAVCSGLSPSSPSRTRFSDSG